MMSLDDHEPVTDNTVFEAASLSKPVFAFFTMRMVEEGVVDLDRPLAFYLADPEMETDERYKRVTARMVLCHTTGFPNWRWFDPADPALHIKPGEFYMKFDPGTRFSYSGEGYQFLARVLAHNNHVNMEQLSSLFQEEVAVPLGMRYSYFTWDKYLYDHKAWGHKNGKTDYAVWGAASPSDNSKILNAAGGFCTESVSYAQFLIALMDGKGLRRRDLDELLKEQTKVPSDQPSYKEDGIRGWSLGFGMKPTPFGTEYKHGGNNGGYQAGFAFCREKRIGYVFFTNCDRGSEFNKDLESYVMDSASP